MYKILYINCDSGMSGDMFLGAMISMGVPEGYLRSKLLDLYLDEFELNIDYKYVNGLKVADVDVLLKNEDDLTTYPYSGDFRNYAQILYIIDNSALSDNDKTLSKKIFEIKATAEAMVHGVPKSEVRFHEAGAVDSIVDIVGAAICLNYFSADKVISKIVPTGYGHVECACGILPVPAPAVKQILKNTKIPYYRSDIHQGILTPTGASIVAGVTDEFGTENIMGQRLATGYGVGKRNTGLPPLEVALITC